MFSFYWIFYNRIDFFFNSVKKFFVSGFFDEFLEFFVESRFHFESLFFEDRVVAYEILFFVVFVVQKGIGNFFFEYQVDWFNFEDWFRAFYDCD